MTLPLFYSTNASAAAVKVKPLSFVVLNPDGTPATEVVALARITDGVLEDPALAKIHTFEASRSGAVSISIPLNDPYVLKNFPREKIFNVHVTLLDPGDKPGEGAEAFGEVMYVLNLGDPSFPMDFAKMQNAVVTLEALPEGSGTDAAADPLEDGEVCQWYDASYTCVVTSHPSDTQAEQVVVAHNIGASHDMTTYFSVEGTVKIATSTVSGVDGLFVEARGSHTISKEATDRYGFASSDDGPNEDAALYTDFAKVEERHCFIYTGTCNKETTFIPDRVRGSTPLLPTSETIYHGYAQPPGPGNTDCTVHVVDYYSNSRGVSIQEDWTFGFDFEGQYKVFTLHVTSVKQTTTTNDYQNTYTWTVTDDPYFPHHHVFIRLGNLNTGSEAGSICPPDAPHAVWTDSSWVNKDNPVPPPPQIPPTPDEAEPVREPAEREANNGRREGDRCVAAPERCGRDG